MFMLELGGGAVAFEIEGEADRVGSVDPNELIKRKWPAEVVENYLRYRSMHSETLAQSPSVVIENTSTSTSTSEDGQPG
jgi:hypothetical protein